MIRLSMCLQERLIQLSDGRNLRYDWADEPEVTPMNRDEKEKGTFCGVGEKSKSSILDMLSDLGHDI